MAEYRVNLDIYNGPLDLLLYLIRRDEVDIYDIPISHITEQYIQHVDVIKQLDPNLAGDFLVLAATLMEIKTRMLLPQAPAEEGGPDELQTDPRADLVRQLLEYKAFKDAAGDLRDAAAEQAMRFPRRPGAIERDEAELDLEDVQIWDLFDAFSKLMTAIGQQARGHEIIYDDTPIELHATDICDRLEREGPMTFEVVFEGRTDRGEIVGLFLAMLELIRRRWVLARQDRNFGEIRIELNPDPPAEDETERDENAGQRPADAAPATGATSRNRQGADTPTMDSAEDVNLPDDDVDTRGDVASFEDVETSIDRAGRQGAHTPFDTDEDDADAPGQGAYISETQKDDDEGDDDERGEEAGTVGT